MPTQAFLLMWYLDSFQLLQLIIFADEIKDHFVRFGPLTVDWPHKAQSKAYFPPKGKHIFFSEVCGTNVIHHSVSHGGSVVDIVALGQPIAYNPVLCVVGLWLPNYLKLNTVLDLLT